MVEPAEEAQALGENGMKKDVASLDNNNQLAMDNDNFSGSGHTAFMATWPPDLDLTIMSDGAVREVIVIDDGILPQVAPLSSLITATDCSYNPSFKSKMATKTNQTCPKSDLSSTGRTVPKPVLMDTEAETSGCLGGSTGSAL